MLNDCKAACFEENQPIGINFNLGYLECWYYCLAIRSLVQRVCKVYGSQSGRLLKFFDQQTDKNDMESIILGGQIILMT